MLEDFMNTQQAAEFLGISVQAVRYFVRLGELAPAPQVLTGAYVFSRAELIRFRQLREQLTTTEVAKLLGVTSSMVRRWARQGDLPSEEIGKRHRFRRSDVMIFARDRGLITAAPSKESIKERRQLH